MLYPWPNGLKNITGNIEGMKKIILIEEDPDLLDILKELLNQEGFEVITYPDKNSVKRIIINRPDLVLLDNQLTDGLGSRLCREIKSNDLTKDIPVLLISGDENLASLARESGADGFLAKPFNIAVLVRMVKKWSGLSHDMPNPDQSPKGY